MSSQKERNEIEKFSIENDPLFSDPFSDMEPTSPEVQRSEENKSKRLLAALPEESRKRALELAGRINPADHEAATAFGTEAQSKLYQFSHAMLDHVQKKDVGAIGEILNDLMRKLQQAKPEDLQPQKGNFFSRLFGKISTSINETLSKYQKVGAQVDRISVKLNHAKTKLVEDIELLEGLYEQNKEYFYALNTYIAAAQVKLEELQGNVIPELKRKAEASGDQMVYQEVNDMVQFANRLEKRAHDLELSRQVTIQTAPQIRLIQNTNQALTEKIQSSIMTAIPLWKNQIAIALTLGRQKQVLEAQKQVSDTTNALLLKNSEMLKTNSIEAAKENERGVVDLETLKQTQSNLISTIEETLAIQAEGRSKRQQAEEELAALEHELKQKLLEFKKD